MTGEVQTKRSIITGVVPAAGSLLEGELAVNIADGLMWIGDAAGDPIPISSGSGGSSMIVQETKPDEAAYEEGQGWLRTSDMTKFTLYVDVDSRQWVDTG